VCVHGAANNQKPAAISITHSCLKFCARWTGSNEQLLSGKRWDWNMHGMTIVFSDRCIAIQTGAQYRVSTQQATVRLMEDADFCRNNTRILAEFKRRYHVCVTGDGGLEFAMPHSIPFLLCGVHSNRNMQLHSVTGKCSSVLSGFTSTANMGSFANNATFLSWTQGALP
jgi:hypothetical protein